MQLRQCLLEVEVVDRFVESVEVGLIDHADHGLLQRLEGFLRVGVAGFEQGLQAVDRRAARSRLKGADIAGAACPEETSGSAHRMELT